MIKLYKLSTGVQFKKKFSPRNFTGIESPFYERLYRREEKANPVLGSPFPFSLRVTARDQKIIWVWEKYEILERKKRFLRHSKGEFFPLILKVNRDGNASVLAIYTGRKNTVVSSAKKIRSLKPKGKGSKAQKKNAEIIWIKTGFRMPQGLWSGREAIARKIIYFIQFLSRGTFTLNHCGRRQCCICKSVSDWTGRQTTWSDGRGVLLSP